MRQLSNLAFSFHVQGVIWKTAIDRKAGKLALEIRNQDELNVSYAILDLVNHTLGEPMLIEGADWWSSLQLFEDGYLFIEKYQDPQNPLDKALIIANSGSGEVLKHLPGHQMIHVRDGKLIYQRIEDPSGQLSEDLPEITMATGNHHFSSPVVFQAGSPSFDVVKEYLSGQDITSLVDYLEVENTIIISYYVGSEKELVRKLVVIREEQEIYHEILDHQMEGIAPEGFFVFNNYLVFIVERKQINAIEL